MANGRSNNNDWAEKREFKRAPVNFFLSYKVCQPLAEGEVPKEEVAQAIDISEGGMGILTSVKPPSSPGQDTLLSLNFDLTMRDGSTRAISAVGAVRYSIMLFDQAKNRVGLQFVKIDDKDKEIIAAFVASSMLL